MSAALVLHGGGPTAVLNASLAGLALAWKQEMPKIPLLASRFGVEGLLQDDLIPLKQVTASAWKQLREAPGSAIGSTRRSLSCADFDQIFELLTRRDIRWLFPTGGNGTQRMALALHQHALRHQFPLHLISIPKTIDNDIPCTWCTPGYGSVARYFAFAARDLGLDNRALPSPVTVLETLGRDTGWVTAATALARTGRDDAPHLIYLPESRVSLDQVAADVERCVTRLGRCVVAVCEGLRDEKGQPFGADVQRDRDGVQRLAANLGHTLSRLLAEKLGIRVRSEKPGLTGRSSWLGASDADRRIAEQCGAAAARFAKRGQAGVMVAVDHSSRGFSYTSVPLQTVASGLREFPANWIRPGDVDPAFLRYLRPLAGTIPSFPTLLDL